MVSVASQRGNERPATMKSAAVPSLLRRAASQPTPRKAAYMRTIARMAIERGSPGQVRRASSVIDRKSVV
jgi:hypothetical protein